LTEEEIERSIYDVRSKKFTTLNILRQCPLVLINVGWTQNRVLGTEENLCDGKWNAGSMKQRKEVGHWGCSYNPSKPWHLQEIKSCHNKL
jgi:hypothetical protein